MGYAGKGKGNLQPFDEAAIAMFQAAAIKPTIEDVKLLGDDIQAVADEFDADNADDERAPAAAALLRARIGGYQNLESYMKCLRVGAKHGPKTGFYRS